MFLSAKYRNAVSKIRNFNYIVIDQAVISGSNFLTTIIAGRFLGVSAFGEFSLLWLIILFFSSISVSAFISPMQVISSTMTEKKEVYYRCVYTQQILFCFFSAVATFISLNIWSIITNISNYKNIASLSIIVFLFQWHDFLRRLAILQKKEKNTLLADVINYTLKNSAIFFLFLEGEKNISTILTSTIAGLVISTLYIQHKTKIKTLFGHELIFYTKRNWVSSKWLITSTLFQWASGNYIFIAAGSVLGSSAVGVLRAAQNIMSGVQILFMALENIMPQRISQLYFHSGLKGLKKGLSQYIIAGFIPTIICAMLVYLLSDWLLLLFYGKSYIKYAHIVEWFGFIYILMFTAFPLRAFFRVIEKTSAIFLSYFVAALYAIILSPTIMKQSGLIGGVINLFFNYLIITLVLTLFYLLYSKRLSND